MGVKISKGYSSYTLFSKAKSFQTCPEFSSQFFFHCTLWRFQKPQLSGKRAIVEHNGLFSSVVQRTWCTFGLVALKIIRCTTIFFFEKKKKISKTLLHPQIAAETYQTAPELSSQRSTQNYVWDV